DILSPQLPTLHRKPNALGVAVEPVSLGPWTVAPAVKPFALVVKPFALVVEPLSLGHVPPPPRAVRPLPPP
uniref:hypothetical protein n=1 Tax=Streptomyces hokutonensis TaxID=1306990 RepID=UPI001C3F35F4